MAPDAGSAASPAKAENAIARSRPFALKIRSGIPFITLTAGTC